MAVTNSSISEQGFLPGLPDLRGLVAGIVGGYTGEWELVSPNAGVSSMHIAITHNNKAIMFDATNFGPTTLQLAPNNCRIDPRTKKQDCTSHAIEFDIETRKIRPLKVLTNPWCSAGGFAPDGTLVQTGGWFDGGRVVRYLRTCATCDWTEYPASLSGERWYSTQQILPDGSFILVGGRRQFGYEFVPKEGQSNKAAILLPLLRETTDEVEDNLYPFVHLSTDGNLFIFANNRSILLDYKANKVVREFPPLKGGARNYPGCATSALLPINLQRPSKKKIPAEVIVCGGTPQLSAKSAGAGTFLSALATCARIVITSPTPAWKFELMPTGRVISDMLILPNADLLIINGASKGSAGWGFAREPALRPVLYSPRKPRSQRFRSLAAASIPRMYHSTSAVLPDGRILVAGSNTNDGYEFTGVLFPTELRVEKFSPPYLDPAQAAARPEISAAGGVPRQLAYGEAFVVEFGMVAPLLPGADVKVTMYAPPFTTHAFSMNQRLLLLKITSVDLGLGKHKVAVVAPPSPVVAPPGYYMLVVVHQGIPSKAAWVRIQ
ncbi:aldehyde oxidase GLOX1-like [Wolffia australiana]